MKSLSKETRIQFSLVYCQFALRRVARIPPQGRLVRVHAHSRTRHAELSISGRGSCAGGSQPRCPRTGKGCGESYRESRLAPVRERGKQSTGDTTRRLGPEPVKAGVQFGRAQGIGYTKKKAACIPDGEGVGKSGRAWGMKNDTHPASERARKSPKDVPRGTYLLRGSKERRRGVGSVRRRAVTHRRAVPPRGEKTTAG